MAQTSTYQAWHQPTALTHRIASALRSMWTAYWAYKAEQATAFVLHSLDDRTLKDIGMDRSEIESVVHNPSSDRRVTLRAAAAERHPRPSMCDA
jgi:uncharacterized protein YjiS (DUF1127 family)